MERKDTGTVTWYLVVGAHTWGRGQTLDEARANCRKAGAARGEETRAYRFVYPDDLDEPVKPFVDDLGRIMADTRAIHHERVRNGRAQ